METKANINYLKAFCLACFVLGICHTYGQGLYGDSTNPFEFINVLDFEEENSEEIYDIESKLEQLETYSKYPLNINQASLQQLQRMEVFSDMQIQALLRYREDYGKILGAHELKLIYGFSTTFVDALTPYLCFGDMQTTKLSFANLKTYGKNTLVFKNTLVTPSSKAYEQDYVGNPLKMYIKYHYQWTDRISLGLALEKDAGEALAWNKKTKIFDHRSFHVMLAQQKISFRKLPSITINKLIIGNYHLQFGQGLCLASSSTFGGFSNATTSIRSGVGLKTFASSAEYGYFSGGACDLGYKKWDLRLFYSLKDIDAKIENGFITSLPQTGFHRKTSELETKNTAEIKTMGGNINYNGSNVRIGLTFYTKNFSHPYTPSLRLDNQFSYTPSKSIHTSTDYHYYRKRLHLFGETAFSPPSGWASLNGLQYTIPPRCALFLLFRSYSRDYESFYSNGLGMNSKINNERGLRMGINLNLSANMSIDLIMDRYQFNWLSYYVEAPLYGEYYMIRWNYLASLSSTFSVSGKFIRKTKTEGQESPIEKIEDTQIPSGIVHVQHQLSPQVKLKTRLQLSIQGAKTNHLFYQEIESAFFKNRLRLYARLTLFDTDGWNSKLYTYETDVYQSFSIPAFYDQGSKFFLMAKYEMNRYLSFWIRYAYLYYYGKDKIGSGPDEIQGNKKQELKLVLRVKF